MIRIDQYCIKHSIRTQSFVEFLIIENILFRVGDKIHTNNKKIADIKDNKIYVDEKYFYHYLNDNDNYGKIVLNSNYQKPVHKIDDIQKRMKTLIDIADKKILFLDFEFVEYNYYEVGFEVFYKGKRINKGYFFESNVYENNYMFENKKFFKVKKINDKKRIIKNKKNFKEYTIESKKKINYILEQIVSDVDYIVAHQCESELKILKNNGIDIQNDKCICTATILQNIQLFFDKNGKIKLIPSLKDLIELFKIKFDSSNLHFAFYDVVATRKVFFKIVEMFSQRIM